MTSASIQSTPRMHDAPEGVEPCLILGGGISGLALAASMTAAGGRVLVLDAAEVPGGVMRSVHEDRFLFECGPNTVLDKQPSLGDLVRWAGIEDEMIRVPLKGQARYVWHEGRLHEVPSGPGALMRSRLFSWPGKLRLLRELFVPVVPEDESLREFVVRRLGCEAYDRAFLPMVQGIGAGDPARLSTSSAFPMLKEMERTGGSIIRGFIAAQKAARRSGIRREVGMISFKDGLSRLPTAIAARLGDRYKGGMTVERITPEPSGWAVHARSAEGCLVVRAGRVVLCAPAGTVAGWIDAFEPVLASKFRKVHYCPLVSVALGLRRDSLRLPPGFGFLAARDHDVRMLGAIFNSNFFPGRAPEGCVAMTVMLGGDLDPAAVELDDQSIMEILRRDLGRVLGWDGRHEAARINRWPEAIPQYEMGHAGFVTALQEAEARHEGLCFFGNWRGGVALQDRVEQARLLASVLAGSSITSAGGPANEH